jgi:hypothetical protein
LVVCKVDSDPVKDEDRCGLDHSIQLNELEGLDGHGKASSSFSEQERNARDIEDLTGEWSSNRGLSIRERNTSVCLFKGSAIVGSVSTHSDEHV